MIKSMLQIHKYMLSNPAKEIIRHFWITVLIKNITNSGAPEVIL